jgi:hypothetical protein
MRQTARILQLLLMPALLAGQGTAGDPLTYRGFALTAPYAEFTRQAGTLLAPDADPLLCTTSRRTAQLMECGAVIRDTSDGAGFYLAAYILEGEVAFLSFGDSGEVSLVTRAQRDLVARLGPPRAVKTGMWEWRSGRQFARLTWRGRGTKRWIYIALWDDGVMARISRYANRRPR